VRSLRRFGFALAFLVASPAGAGEWLLAGGAHGYMADYGQGLKATMDLTVGADYAPVPELAFGLDTVLVVPLQVMDVEKATKVAFSAVPHLALHVGDEQMWSYAKAGCGVLASVRPEGTSPALILSGALGFAVAPADLLVFFGFEFNGQLDIAGVGPARAVGLGGYLGYRF
jgi:hypothetical protein